MNPVVEIGGKRYMNTKTAAQLWNISPNRVAEYCNQNLIPGAGKLGGKSWLIPMSSIKPLSKEQIRKLLFLSVQLHNNPSFNIDYSALDINPDNLRLVYQHLASIGYISSPVNMTPPERLPYEICISDLGMELIKQQTQPRGIKPLSETAKEWVPVVKDLASLLVLALSA